MQPTIKKSLILLFFFAIHHFVLLAGKGQQPILLFTHHAIEKTGIQEALHFFDQKEAVIRFGEVQLNDHLRSADEIQEGDELLLNLFSDVSYKAIVSRVKHNESRGKVEIVLTDTRGNVVKRRPVANEGDVQQTLNVAHLSGGIYLLSIESEYKFPVWQLLKLHE